MSNNYFTPWLRKPFLVALTVASVFFLLYLFTLAPTVMWGDEARFQQLIPTFGLEFTEVGHPLWVVLSYPFTLLPIGEIAWRVNFATMMFGVAAIYFVFLCAFELTLRADAAAATAIAFGVSHTFWSLSVRPQSHSLNAMILAIVLWLILRWHGKLRQLYMASFLFGIGLTNHLLLFFSCFGLAWFVGQRARKFDVPLRLLLPAPLFAAAGFLPFAIGMALQGTVAGTQGSVWGYFLGWLTIHAPIRFAALWSGYTGYNFIGLACILIVAGVIYLWQQDRGTLIGLCLLYVGNVYFVFDLALPDQYKYYIPSYLVLSLFVGPGYLLFWRLYIMRNSAALPVNQQMFFSLVMLGALILAPPLVYGAMPDIVRVAGHDQLLGARTLPGRDMLAFFLTPSKRDYYGARDYATSALQQMESGSVLFADHTPYMALRYMQAVEELRPDVRLIYWVPDTPFRPPTASAIYLADIQNYYPMDAIQRKYQVQQQGVLYRLIPLERQEN